MSSAYARVEGGSISTVLRQVVVPIVNWNKCKTLNNVYCLIFTQNMLCAGHREGGKDFCQGDSGGPLVCKQGNSWFQYGIVNFVVYGCANSNSSVYADVVNFLPWIQEKTGS